jgi:hypothetical protein
MSYFVGRIPGSTLEAFHRMFTVVERTIDTGIIPSELRPQNYNPFYDGQLNRNEIADIINSMQHVGERAIPYTRYNNSLTQAGFTRIEQNDFLHAMHYIYANFNTISDDDGLVSVAEAFVALKN